MDKYEQAQLKRGNNVLGFRDQHPDEFAATAAKPNARVIGYITTVESAVNNIRTLAGTQSASSSASGGSTGRIQALLAAIRTDLVAISRTARLIKQENADFDVNFDLPTSESAESIIAAANAFKLNATPHEALFIEYEIRPDFLQDLTDDTAAYAVAAGNRADQNSGQEEDTIGLNAEVKRLIAAINGLDVIFRNRFHDQPQLLATWRMAAHYEKPAYQKRQTTANP